MDNLVTLGLVETLKNSNLFLETGVKELNQNKNPKQSIRLNAVRKQSFTLAINE